MKNLYSKLLQQQDLCHIRVRYHSFVGESKRVFGEYCSHVTFFNSGREDNLIWSPLIAGAGVSIKKHFGQLKSLPSVDCRVFVHD
jgi:hypothetical protein